MAPVSGPGLVSETDGGDSYTCNVNIANVMPLRETLNKNNSVWMDWFKLPSSLSVEGLNPNVSALNALEKRVFEEVKSLE